MVLPEQNYPGLRDSVLKLDYLPPLSPTATRLLAVAADPELEITALAGIIEADPPLTARVLGLANAAFFGQVRPVLDVEQAIIRVLGLNMVRSLALSMALAGSFDTRACLSFRLSEYWMGALATAQLAAAVGRHCGQGGGLLAPDALYLCGLLHDFGALVLVQLRPREMAQVYASGALGVDQDVAALERRLLGVDRWEAGAWLALRWHLPEVVVHTLGHLANELYDGPHVAVVRVVRAARRWAEVCNGPAAPLDIPGVPATASAAAVAEVARRMDELRAMAATLG